MKLKLMLTISFVTLFIHLY